MRSCAIGLNIGLCRGNVDRSSRKCILSMQQEKCTNGLLPIWYVPVVPKTYPLLLLVLLLRLLL